MTTAAVSERRGSYLASELDDLARFVGGWCSDDRPPAVRIGALSVPIDSWEWDALIGWCGPGRAGWQALLANGVALEAKCVTDLERAAHPDSLLTRAVEASGSDLQFDAILGYKLMIGLQRSVERMVIQGRMDQAKKLTQFRHRVNESVTTVGAHIGEAALEEAETLGVASGEYLEDEAEGQTPPRSRHGKRTDEKSAGEKNADKDGGIRALLDLEDELEKIAAGADAPAAVPQAREEAPSSRWSPRLVLGGILTVLSLVWFFVVAWPAATHKTVPAFTLADFAKVDTVQDVVARPPSLYVQVDEQKWRLLSEEERRRVVEAVAATIEPAGYSGARFTGATGAAVAQWLKMSGVRVHDLSKPPT